jgi:threonine synthase
MVKPSTRARYALRAMVEVAVREGAGPVLLRDIAKSERISAKDLEQLASALRRAGLVQAAGGVTVAVMKKLIASGRIPANETIVACITGNGLKTAEPPADRLGEPLLVEPSLSSFEERAQHVLEGALA